MYINSRENRPRHVRERHQGERLFWGLRFSVQGLGFRLQVLGFRVQGLGFGGWLRRVSPLCQPEHGRHQGERLFGG